MDYQGNFLQRGLQRLINFAVSPLSADNDKYEAESQARRKAQEELVLYYNGKQRLPLKTSKLGHDYNVITNHLKVVVDRSVSDLFGAGVEFDLPGDEKQETEQEILLRHTWDANKRGILLHDLGQFGSVYGTPAMKIVPGGRALPNGEVADRLVALNPFNLAILTAPDDIDKVVVFVYRWNDRDTAWRELTELQESGTWLITTQKCDKSTGTKWQTQGEPVAWEYAFPPIIHGKNLPNAGNVYGKSDIEDVIDLQDRYNEARSNVNKILAIQAFAKVWVAGGRLPRFKDTTGRETDTVDMRPETVIEFTNADAKLGVIQPTSDMAASTIHMESIRRDIYDSVQIVDSQSVKDKVGALTNFGLRVLFKNEIAKNATKQLLYGDLLCRVNSALLQLHGYMAEDADPGEVVWGDPLPVDKLGLTQELQAEKNMGVTSDETIQRELGRDPQVEQERLAAQKANTPGDFLSTIMAGRQ